MNSNNILRPLAVFFLLIAVTAQGQIPNIQSEDTVTFVKKGSFFSQKEMVVAAHPLAVEAGAEILRDGGSAVDAMVSVQMVLNLVEPQSSGIGGGAFLLYHDEENQMLVSLDGREMAPEAANETLFLDSNGRARSWSEVVPGGLSVGVPGTLALMKHAHFKYGRLPWKNLFEHAIRYATEGFLVSPRLAGSLSRYGGQRLKKFDQARSYFFPNGEPLKAGEALKNPLFANTLRQISGLNNQSFYEGQIAEDLVNAVQSAAINPGVLTLSDLSRYSVVERHPVCVPYREHKICGMGPPSSGGIAVGQILGILQAFNLRSLGPEHPLTWHLFSEAGKLAYADRNMYVADDDFTDVPVSSLISEEYLSSRSAMISFDRGLQTPVRAGNPDGIANWLPDERDEMPGTSHVSIIDQYGNAVSLTTTIESGFGSGLFVRGFFLNNELTDFAFVPSRNGKLVANRVQPLKRPRSSMAPTIVYGPDGKVKYILGSPGGSRIISYVSQTIIGLIDFDLSPQQAIDYGRITSRNGIIDIERNSTLTKVQSFLEARGNQVKLRDLNSGLHVIAIYKGRLTGGADGRREGIALGR